MKQFYLTLALVCLGGWQLSAQTSPCGTNPSPEELLRLAVPFDQVHQSVISLRNAEFMIPIKVHVIRHTDGTGGLDYGALMEELDETNELFMQGGMGFYLVSDVNYID